MARLHPIVLLSALFLCALQLSTAHSLTLSTSSTTEYSSTIEDLPFDATVIQQQPESGYSLITLTVYLDRPISKSIFFDPPQPWSQQTIITSFTAQVQSTVEASTASGGELHGVVSQFRSRNTLLCYIFSDRIAADNMWPYLGNAQGLRSILDVLNGFRGDKSYSFSTSTSSQQSNYPARCLNAEHDEDEMETDCGGPCIPCEGGAPCERDTDCLTDECIPVEDYSKDFPKQPPAEATMVCSDQLNQAVEVSMVFVFLLSIIAAFW